VAIVLSGGAHVGLEDFACCPRRIGVSHRGEKTRVVAQSPYLLGGVIWLCDLKTASTHAMVLAKQVMS
jgi:hypothetical protein